MCDEAFSVPVQIENTFLVTSRAFLAKMGSVVRLAQLLQCWTQNQEALALNFYH